MSRFADTSPHATMFNMVSTIEYTYCLHVVSHKHAQTQALSMLSFARIIHSTADRQVNSG